MGDRKHILVVSDSRLAGVEEKSYPGGWYVRHLSVSGLRLTEMTALITDELKKYRYHMVIPVGLYCDLMYRVRRPEGASTKYGLLHANREPNWQDLFNQISAHTYEWKRSYEVDVLWVTPYLVSVSKYNTLKMEQIYNEPGLTAVQEEECSADEWALQANLQELRRRMFERRITMFDLNKLEVSPVMTAGDGVHFELETRQWIFDYIVEVAVAVRPFAVLPEARPTQALDAKLNRAGRRKRARIQKRLSRDIHAAAHNPEVVASARQREGHDRRSYSRQ